MKKITITTVICACILIFAGKAFAQNMYAAWNTDNGAVWFFGEFEDCGDKDITFTIVSEGAEGELSDGNLPHDIRLGRTDENGRFSIEIPLKLHGGMFSCMADAEQKSEKCSFTFIDEESADEIVRSLNKCTSNDEAEECLKSDSRVLGVDSKLISKDLCGMLLSRIKREAFSSAMDFYGEYLASAAILKIKNGEELLPVLLQYRFELGVSPEAIQDFSAEHLTVLTKLLAKADLSTESFKKNFSECVFLTKVVCCEKYKDLRKIIENEGEDYGFDITPSSQYASVGLKDKVFSYMLSGMENINTLDEAVELFDKAVKEAKKANGAVSGGSGGSGSSGGIGGGKLSVSANVPEQAAFSDISSHWARKNIEKLASKGKINGYPDGTFAPDNTITRAEFVKIICGITGLSYKSGCGFSDVGTNDWFYAYVSAAYENGIITGYGNFFMPNDAVSRQDAAVILYRYLNLKGNSDANAFNDSADIADYAVTAVNALTTARIIKGDGNNFMPQRKLTRAEAATLFCNAEDYYERQGAK